MFGKNQIVGQKYFKDADNKLFITSMFVTLQGEGPYRGEPAFFVRFAKCNLACSFCDTYFDNGDWLTLEEVETKIDLEIARYFAGDQKLAEETPFWATHTVNKKRDMVLVITGGEPMLQKNIVPFLRHMNLEFRNTQIESNGLLWQYIPDETTLVVSPKCNEKNGMATQYLKPNKQVLERADCLKFVMEAVGPYSEIPAWAHAWRIETGKEIFISPMNMYNDQPKRKMGGDLSQRSKEEVISFWTPGLLNMKVNQRNHEYCAKYCLDHGLTFNLQIHLYAGLA